MSDRPTERDVTYPCKFDEQAFEALMSVRGARAEQVKLRLTREVQGLVEHSNSGVQLGIVPAGDYRFTGSNELPGSWWRDTIPFPGKQQVDKETLKFCEGRNFIQLARVDTDTGGLITHASRNYVDYWVAREDWNDNVLVVEGLFDPPGAEDRLIALIKGREKEFRIALGKWLLAQDAKFTKSAETRVAKSNKPIRHPGGKTHTQHNREFFWDDAIWCGDVTFDPLQEFFELTESQMDDFVVGGTELGDWAENVFNEEFRKTLPDLAHLLEG
jgi:hypothetical protein